MYVSHAFKWKLAKWLLAKFNQFLSQWRTAPVETQQVEMSQWKRPPLIQEALYVGSIFSRPLKSPCFQLPVRWCRRVLRRASQPVHIRCLKAGRQETKLKVNQLEITGRGAGQVRRKEAQMGIVEHRTPVVAGAAALLWEVDVLRVVELRVRRGEDAVDDARLEVHEHSARHVVRVVRLKLLECS